MSHGSYRGSLDWMKYNVHSHINCDCNTTFYYPSDKLQKGQSVSCPVCQQRWRKGTNGFQRIKSNVIKLTKRLQALLDAFEKAVNHDCLMGERGVGGEVTTAHNNLHEARVELRKELWRLEKRSKSTRDFV